ncbi:hypothetical protein D3C81_1414250 [compost metagenome]
MRRDVGLLQHALQTHELSIQFGVIGQAFNHQAVKLIAQYIDVIGALRSIKHLDGEAAQVRQFFCNVDLLCQAQGVEPRHHRQQVGLQVSSQFFRSVSICAHRRHTNEFGFQTMLDLCIECEIVVPGCAVEQAGGEQVEAIVA